MDMTENNQARGRLYLIPSPLGDYPPEEVLPRPVLERIQGIRTYVVEETRTARRFLSAAGLKGHIGELEFHELNEHTDPGQVEAFLELFDGGNDVGLISEAPQARHRGGSLHRAVFADARPDGFRA